MKSKKKYIVVSTTPFTFNQGDIPQERIAPLVDTRFPSNYKKLVNYTLSWQTRNIMEASGSPTMFVTFTYNPEHYVEDRLIDGDIRFSLKDDWQRFTKRLRINLERSGYDIPWKYYVISERGDDGRLHFHALLFGFEHTCFDSVNKKGQRVQYVNFSPITDIINKSWGQGFTVFEAACPENIRYVTKYLHKRRISPDYISLKSQGLGLSYLTPNRIKHFQETETATFHLNGKQYYLPRYVKGKIFSKEQLEVVNSKIQQDKFLKDFEKVKKIQHNTDYRQFAFSEHDTRCLKNLLFDNGRFQNNPRLLDVISTCNVLGIKYDDVTDDMVVCYEITDPVRHYRLRQRYMDNLRMKSVFNKRL